MSHSVFITGASGVIGSSVVPRLLEDKNLNISLLLRAESEKHLSLRFQKLLDYWNLPPVYASRISPFRGDMKQAQLGLSKRNFESLTKQTTHILHTAADVRLNQPLQAARESMVHSLEHLLAFTNACKQLVKFDYISTVGVAGATLGTVLEKPLTHARSFRNTYEQTKAEAEEQLFAEHIKGLPLTIYRPSMVVGNSTDGRVLYFQVFYHLCEFLTGRKTFGMQPSTKGFALDIIPVDYVASFLALAHKDPSTIGQVYHLSSGEAGTLSIDDLISHLRQRLGERGEEIVSLKTIPNWLFAFAARCLSYLGPHKIRRRAGNLPYFLSYLSSPQFFDNRKALAYLTEHQLKLPKAKDYLPLVLDYYFDNRNR